MSAASHSSASFRHDVVADVGYYLTSALVFVAVTLWVFRGLLSRLDRELIGVHNDVLYSFGTMSWQWHVLGRLDLGALLDAPLMAPLAHGYAFGDNLFALTLLGAPMAWAGHEVLAYNVALLATFVLTAVCATGFGRALTGSRLAGVLGGLCCGFFPIRFGTLYHINNLALFGVALALWALVRWLDTRLWRWVLVGVGAAYVQFLCSIQLFVFLVLLAAAWLLGRWLAGGCRLRGRELVQLGVAAALEALMLAPWLPTYVEAQQYAAASRSTDEMALYRALPGDWLTRLSPGPVVVGLLLVALVYLGLTRVPRWRRAAWCAAPGEEHLPWLLGLSLVAVVLSFGPVLRVDGIDLRLPFYALMKSVPYFDAVRVPQRIQRVAVILMCGAGAVSFGWLLRVISGSGQSLAAGRVRSRVKLVLPRLLVTLAIGALAVVALPKVAEPMRPLPRQAYADVIAALPESALVFPVPLELNWPERPPLDLLAIATARRFVGGYGSTIPDLFWVLARRASRLPEALAAVRATGATHLLVRTGALPPAALAHLAELSQMGAGRIYSAAGIELWHLGESRPRVFEPLSLPISDFAVDGPARVARGQLVTLALSPSVVGTYVDGVVSRRLAVETLDADGRLVGAQMAELSSPMLIEPNGSPYRLVLHAPRLPGVYAFRIVWPTCAARGVPCRLSHAFVVDSRLETSADARVHRYAITEVARPVHIARKSSVALKVRVRNEDERLFLATSDEALPANRGEIAFHVMIRGKHGGPQLLRPFEHHQALSRDLAPGEEVVTTLDFEAPSELGEYIVVVRLGSYQLGSIRDNPPIVLAPPFVVE